MKIIVIADSHGNIANLKHVMEFGKKIKVGAVIHCGDWDNVKAVETVLLSGIPLYTVLGNADIDPKIAKKLEVKSKKFTQNYLEFELDNKRIGVVHNVDFLPKVDILFCGHSHKQYKKDNIVNPGALEYGINFAIFDTKTDELEFIHE